MAEPVQPVERTTAPATAVETVIIEVPPEPKKKHRLHTLIITLVVIVVVFIAGFFIADYFAKQYATAYVRDQIVSVLNLDPKSDVDVDLGGGSVILQAISGQINTVNVDVDRIAFGDLAGSAKITAQGVPLDGALPVDKLGIVVTIDEKNVQTLAGSLSGIELKSIKLVDALIRVSTDLNLLVVTLPVTVDLAPGAADGGITFTPETITLNNQKISVDDLKANPLVGGIAGSLLSTQTVCVASYLPQALEITGVKVVASNLVLTINGDGAALAGPDLSTMGKCP